MRQIRIFLAAFAVVAALGAAKVSAERAAGVDYDFIDRPANLPANFQASPGTDLRFLAIKAIDGFRVDAALWQPADKPVAATTLIVGVHGSGGNFVSGSPMTSISPLLAAKGYGVMTISMCWRDELRDTDNFFEGRRDIEAAVYTARALGYQTLVLWGHSLGSIHVQYYAANTWDSDTKAVVLSGMFANLPWKSRHMLVQNEDTFRALSEAAMKSLREGKERELLSLRMRSTQTNEGPLTGQHFLTYRTEASSTADSTYWIRRVPWPILMLRDAGDATIAPFERRRHWRAFHNVSLGESTTPCCTASCFSPRDRNGSKAAHSFHAPCLLPPAADMGQVVNPT
jgi:pimeloyl-ACP methyl ester carboxylesterase